jgi:hypothetical protein
MKYFKGELSHRLVKQFYARTDKRNHGPQIAAQERRRRVLHITNQRMKDTAATAAANAAATEQDPPTINTVANTLQPQRDPLPRTPPRQHHHISESKRTWFDIKEFPYMSILEDDPAVEV